MEKLRNLYAEQAVWIVGKGPSLQYLTKRDIGPGPVITLNEAIIKIEEIGLSNPIFSMQKDGNTGRKRSRSTLIPDCDYTPNCGDRCGVMHRPKKGATLLVCKHGSLYCFPDYSPRHVFEWEKLGLPGDEFSHVIAIKIGSLMGCKKYYFISFDSITHNCMETYVPGAGVAKRFRPKVYSIFTRRVKPYLVDLNYEWITPTKE